MRTIGAVIIAAGYGSFRTIAGRPFPKILESVGDEPMIRHVVRKAGEADLSPRIVVTNPLFHSLVLRSLRSREFHNCTYVIQPDRFGTADATMRALLFLKHEGIENFLLIYADMPLWSSESIRWLAAEQRRLYGKPSLSLLTVSLIRPHPEELERYGRVLRDKTGRMCRIVEPAHATKEEIAASDSVNPSLYFWNLEWFEEHAPLISPLSKGDGGCAEQHIPPLVERLYKEGGAITELELADPEEALGVNTPAELTRVRGIYDARLHTSDNRLAAK